MKRRIFLKSSGRWIGLTAAGTITSGLGTGSSAQEQASKPQIEFTWLGHGTVLYRSVNGRYLLVDPWISANPAVPSQYRRVVGEGFERIDFILYTHGHGDHFELPDARALIERFNPLVLAPWELSYVIKAEIPSANTQHFVLGNKGTWTDFEGIRIVMVPASHSSGAHFSGFEGKTRYVGNEVGFIIEFENGLRVYHSGDTGLMADMKLVIGDFFRPDVAVLSMGGVYTMGPEEAAYSCKLVRPRIVIPIHYKTFPALVQSADGFVEYLAEYAPATRAIVLEPGESTMI